MNGIKFLEWIHKTFGPKQVGDYLDLTERTSRVQKARDISIITEIRLNLQKKIYNPKILNKECLQQFRHELDELSEFSIDRLSFMETFVADFPNEKQIQQNRTDRSEPQGGKAFLMKLEIIHRRRIKDGQS